MTENPATQDIYQLSNLPKNQLWFWIGQNLEPETPFFNMPMAITIQGDLEPERFSRAFQQVINRSDALRTVVIPENGVPQRKVLAELSYSVEFQDLSQQSDPKNQFDQWANQRCQQMFDIEQRMFDAVLFKLADQEYIWYWCQHHLICDGWSTALVYRYVSEFYQKSFTENIEDLPAFPSFEDYAVREQEYRQSKSHAQSESYWKKTLAEPLDTLNFYGRTAREHGTNRAIRVTRDLGQKRTDALKALTKQKPFKSLSPHLSTFQLVSTCLLAYLYRITGNTDLALGTLYHNRATQADKDTVGFFMETAPLRVSASAEDTFESLFKKTKSTSMEVMRHYRFAPGNPINNRAYDVAINYNNATYPDFAGMPISLHWLHTGAWYSHEPLAIQIHDFDATGTFTIAFDFNIGVFDEATQEKAIQHFFNCIDALIEEPSQSLNNFKILTDDEEKLLLGAYKQQPNKALPEASLHQLFEQQVAKTPSKVAVYNSEVSYTYQELNERSNSLAHYLVQLGLKQDQPVGLSFAKHPDMLVAILAILKAGAGYVPLDPEYPDDRLQYMIEDSGIKLLVTQQDLVPNLPKGNYSSIAIDADWNKISKLSSTQLDIEVGLNNLAYVIYTSGSTGQAKGVMIEHRSIVNYTHAAIEAFNIKEQDRILQFASISFDTAGEELYPALSVGASLYIAEDEMKASAKSFLSICEREKINFVDLPTAFWHQITAAIIEDELDIPTTIETLIIGGERAQPQAVANWLDLQTSIALINTYGPTECTIVSSYCELTKENTSREQEAPIGIPVRNLYVYVLDKNMQLVPPGVTGELHIGGAGLARGYLGKQQLTDKSFIPDPFSPDKTAKLYKTGDLVRFRKDGQLEYRDRADDQVKIRGFRIELGEVESALLALEEIEQGIVLVNQSESGDKQLVAYYVTYNDSDLSAGAVRSKLKETLPNYMMPQYLVSLENLPINATGKIDRKALPAPNEEEPSEVEEDLEAPETDSQKAIAKIWQLSLSNNSIGLYDNFFDIGGDSLLMMQVITKLEKELNFAATPRMLVSQNLAQLAAELDLQTASNNESQKSSFFSKVKGLFGG
jgi:amino acid adenylation domain-containing protein